MRVVHPHAPRHDTLQATPFPTPLILSHTLVLIGSRSACRVWSSSGKGRRAASCTVAAICSEQRRTVENRCGREELPACHFRLTKNAAFSGGHWWRPLTRDATVLPLCLPLTYCFVFLFHRLSVMNVVHGAALVALLAISAVAAPADTSFDVIV